MSKNIKLSPKHGVNPTIGVCFYCGAEKNEIALLGKIGGKNDLEAPRKTVLNYEPCEKCAEIMAKGITLIGVKADKTTCGWCVVSENLIEKMVSDQSMKTEIQQKRIAFIDETIFIAITAHSEDVT